MKRHVFITCTASDKRYKSKIMKWGSTGKLGEKVNVLSLDDQNFVMPNGQIDRDRLAWALKESALVILLVGQDNMEHPWLDWEGEFCHQWGIKRVVVRVPYSEGYLPEPFTVLREIAYNPNAIEKELRPAQSTSSYY